MNANRDASAHDVLEPDLPPPRRPKKSNLTPEQAKLRDELAEFRKLNGELFECVRMTFQKALRMGELLTMWKKRVGHGNWLNWLREHLPEVSERSAQVYISLWENRAVLDKYAAAADLTLKDALKMLTNGGKAKTKKKKKAAKPAPPETEEAQPASEESPEPAEPSTPPAEASAPAEQEPAPEPEGAPEPEEAQPQSTNPTKAATAFLTDLFSKVGHLDDKRKLANHIGDLVHTLLGEETTDSEAEPAAPKFARGLEFRTLSDAVEACHDALDEIGNELEQWAENMPENMDSKRDTVATAADEVRANTSELEGLDVPDNAYAPLPCLLLSGSKGARLNRVAEILAGAAEALPECDARIKLEEVADALGNVDL